MLLLPSLSPWNTHWTDQQVSCLVRTHPEPRSAVPHWARDLVDPPAGQWTVVAGPRQVGKTTGLGHVIQTLLDKGVPPKSIAIVPFDQPTIQDEVGVDVDDLIQTLSRQHPTTPEAPLYLLLDEVQELPDWSQRLKAAWDRHHHTVRVLATGSSALRLIRPIEADFPGRIRHHTVHTMKFREVVETHPERQRHADQSLWDRLTALTKRIRSLLADPADQDDLNESLTDLAAVLHGGDRPIDPFLHHAFQEYAVWGGHPRVRPGRAIQPPERRTTFDQAWDAVLARDVPSVGIVKTREFSLLFRHLASNPGGKFVAAAVARDLGVQHATVSEWKRVLEDAFLVQQLMPFKPNLQPTKGKDKAYLQDPGWYAHFRGATDPTDIWHEPVIGLLVENVLVDHARRLQFNLTQSRSLPIGYVKEPETDVVASLGRRWLVLESKYRAKPKRTGPEIHADRPTLTVVATRDHFELPEGDGAYYLPAHLWALVA